MSGEMPDKNWARRALATAASAPPGVAFPSDNCHSTTDRVLWSLTAVTSSVRSSGSPRPHK